MNRSHWTAIPIIVVAICLNNSSAQKASQTPTSKTTPETYITYCAMDGVYASISDAPRQTLVAEIEDVQLYSSGLDEAGAKFSFHQQGKSIFSFELKDLSAPGVWIAEDHAHNRLALTYSDGGALGNSHVRVFQYNDGTISDLSKTIEPAVGDFKSRHYCQDRGNNVQSLKWVDGNLLLMTDVYPTSDCGPDLGHTEGYLVSVPDGQIQKHLTLRQLKQYPGVCLQNDSGK